MNTVEPKREAVATDPRGQSRADVRAAAYALITLETLTAIAAFGSAAMIADPAGAMGLSPAMLDRLPVNSWMLPGMALIASNGVLPTVVAVAELRGERWPRRFGHIAVGAVLLSWPVTETLLFGYPLEGEPLWLRPGVAAAGLMIMGLGLLLRRGEKRKGLGLSSTMRGRSPADRLRTNAE